MGFSQEVLAPVLVEVQDLEAIEATEEIQEGELISKASANSSMSPEPQAAVEDQEFLLVQTRSKNFVARCSNIF